MNDENQNPEEETDPLDAITARLDQLEAQVEEGRKRDPNKEFADRLVKSQSPWFTLGGDDGKA